tara:strand:- start:214 stop:438 length:225 start_codon:yes stop_codon:yes gene_type:complete
MITFLKFILFFILLSYIIRLLTPLILSFIISRFQQKMKKKFDNMNKMNFDNQTKKSNSKPKDDLGEYVDFEEIE